MVFLSLLRFTFGQINGLYHQQFRTTAISTPINEDFTKYSQFSEVESLRTIHSRTYKTKKGDFKSEYSIKPLCFKINGKLEIINSTPQIDANGSWIANQQPIKTKLKSDGTLNIIFSKNKEISISTLNINQKKIGNNSINSISDKEKKIELIEGVDKTISFIEGGFKVNYIISNANSLPEGDLLIRERIDLPESWKLYSENDEVIISDGTNEVGFFGQILCFDQNFEVYKGQYTIENNDGTNFLTLKINSEWLHGNRDFPIIIDPTIAGLPSQWTGGNIPSCFIPTYNKDSLLVNIPAGVSLTGLYVSSSFYADPFTPATMGIGSMYFSTDCASSQYFTITGALANSPGTAYLDSFNLMNPLSCCFPKSCNDTSIYVRFHLGRNSLGTGCNATYIRYDQFTQYPFKVIMYGKTPETYGNEWYVPQTPICSNSCEFTATGYARYGVPPYTFTHPWSQDTVVAGINEGCSAGSKNNIFTLINPNCPIYCDSNLTELPVPPPVIFDACGTQIPDIPIALKPITPAARPIAIYDSTICEGVELTMNLTSCLPGGTVNYFGNGTSGQASFTQLLPTQNDSISLYSYFSYATINGCTSDTLSHNVYVIPNPNSNFSITPNPCIVETPFSLTSNSSTILGPVTSNIWTFDNYFVSSNGMYDSIILIPGEYNICLAVEDLFGCADTSCQQLIIIPAEIENLNVITPNNDNANDVLYFDYLDSFEETEIFIYNRWGNLVFNQSPYDNNWSAEGLTDGVYFYTLKIKDTDKTYSSFFHLVR